MYSDTNTTRSVADAVMKVMNEKLHPNQQKLDVHEPEKDELTADDFKKLRAKKEVKKEEVETVEEGLKDMAKKAFKAVTGGSDEDQRKDLQRKMGVPQTGKKPVKEDIEQIDEVKMADLPSTKVQGRSYGASKPEPHAVDTLRGPKEKELKDIESEKKKKKFSEMVNLYQQKGLKALSEMLVKEEPDNEQFTKELEDAKAKSEGKKPNKEIAKGAVQAVKSEEVQTEEEVIEERHMTDAEMNKREDIVKSMKKGMAGFKERYGDRAKDVMYATATKQAMKEQKEDHYNNGYNHVRDPIADEPYLDNARHRFNELKKQNPHKKGTAEHKEWHSGASAAYEEHKDMLRGH